MSDETDREFSRLPDPDLNGIDKEQIAPVPHSTSRRLTRAAELHLLIAEQYIRRFRTIP